MPGRRNTRLDATPNLGLRGQRLSPGKRRCMKSSTSNPCTQTENPRQKAARPLGKRNRVWVNRVCSNNTHRMGVSSKSFPSLQHPPTHAHGHSPPARTCFLLSWSVRITNCVRDQWKSATAIGQPNRENGKTKQEDGPKKTGAAVWPAVESGGYALCSRPLLRPQFCE